MNSWCSCKGEVDFHYMLDGVAVCGQQVEPEQYMGAAYMALRCKTCKTVLAGDDEQERSAA